MIDFLRGALVHREPEYVVLDVGGVGYRVFCANPFSVSAAGDSGMTTMYIHHHVREDAILLYGFVTREEQSLFRRLLDVTGIGPRVALGILSAGRPEAVISAIYTEDVAFLTKLPGIGKKTAQRIILDLKDKLADLPMTEAAVASGGGAAVPAVAGRTGAGSAWNEAKQALLALGYTEAEADRVWPAVKANAGGEASVDALIKLALQALYKG